ncbi:MAG: hypothetical protein KKC99_07340 [Proteobacteria bacterium]|nr:hypothetical protein [Pseudomonadota bacterium]
MKKKPPRILLALFAVLLTTAFSLSLAQTAGPDWVRMPLRTDKQKRLGYKGGEGFQMTWGISYCTADPKIVYTCSDTTQIWKSTDGGESWTPKHRGFLANGARSVLVDPVNPDIVFAAASLHNNYEDGHNKKDKAEGIYMSTDGGDTWTETHHTGIYRHEETRGNIFAADSKSAKGGRTMTLYCGSYEEGLLRTTDGGKHWTSVGLRNIPITEVVEDPDRPGEFYVATEKGLYEYRGGQPREIGNLQSYPRSISASPGGVLYAATGKAGLLKSTNRGTSFTPLTTGLPEAFFSDVAASPADPNVVYTKVSLGRIIAPYASTDAGKSWYPADNYDRAGVLLSEKLFYFPSPIAPHPTKPKEAIIASNGKGTILRTTDAGKNWDYSATGFTGGRMVDITFVDPTTMLFGLWDHGVYLTEDKGDSFVDLNKDHPTAKNTVKACAVDKDTFVMISNPTHGKTYLGVSYDRGQKWNYFQKMDRMPQVLFSSFHPTRENVIYAGYYRSDDRGKTWIPLDEPIMAMDPNNGDIVYSAKPLGSNADSQPDSDLNSESGMEMDSGADARVDTVVTPEITAGMDSKAMKKAARLAKKKAREEKANKGSGKKTGKEQCTILVSTNRGASWEPLGLPLPFKFGLIQDIEVAATTPERVLVAAQFELLWHYDTQRGWQQVTSKQGIAKNAFGRNFVKLVAVDPRNPNRVAIGKWAPALGQGDGVFLSTDGGNTFNNITGSMGPEVSIWGLEISPFDGAIYAGTSRGTYRLDQ